MEVYTLFISGNNKGRGFGGWVKGTGNQAVLFGKRGKGGRPVRIGGNKLCMLAHPFSPHQCIQGVGYLRLEWSQGRSGGYRHEHDLNTGVSR